MKNIKKILTTTFIIIAAAYIFLITLVNLYPSGVAISSSGHVATDSDCAAPKNDFQTSYCIKNSCMNMLNEKYNVKREYVADIEAQYNFSHEPGLAIVELQDQNSMKKYKCTLRDMEVESLVEKL